MASTGGVVVGEGGGDAVLDVAERRLGLDRDLGVRALPVGLPVVVRQVGGAAEEGDLGEAVEALAVG